MPDTMKIEDPKQANEISREGWNTNAGFWNERMSEGNDFVNTLIWPVTQPLLDPKPGERILDIACGNGLYARRLAALGADVVAFDYAEEMVANAKQRTIEHTERIDYRVLDATDATALLSLGEGQFDAALCQMALMDMAEIDPLMNTLPRLLKPNGRFVFSVTHPCFNNIHTRHVAEAEDREGEIVTTYSVKISGYMTPSMAFGVAIRGQPTLQLYFDRPLQDLLNTGFKAGFVLDGLAERAFPPDHQRGSTPLSWGPNFSEIPPVLVARMRLRNSD